MMTRLLYLLVTLFFVPFSFAADINWTEKSPMPIEVGAFGYAVIDGNIYIIGGDHTGSSIDSVQRYNIASDSWELDTHHGGVLAPLPAARAVLFCGVINGKIHAIGGWENGTYKGDHFIYDPGSNTWSTGPSIPQYPIGQFGASINDKIYVFGGWSGTYRNNVFEYSDSTGWSSKAPMPTARNHGTTAVYDGKIYVLGGQGGQPAQQQPLDVVEVYDPSTDTWATGLAPMPQPQHWLGSSGSPESNATIFVLGPEETGYAYQPRDDMWATLDSMSGSAVGIGTVHGALYALGPEHTLRGILYTIREYAIPTADSLPLSIDVGREGQVWFTEFNAKKVGRFSPNSETFAEYSTTFKPRDIVSNIRDGLVYFTLDEPSNGHYGVLTPVTGAIQEFPTGLPSGSSVDGMIDAFGSFWFNGWDSQAVSRAGKTGIETYTPPSFGYMSGLTEDPYGNIWLTIVQAYENNPRLLKLDTRDALSGTANGFTEIPLPVGRATIRRPVAALGKIWFWNESKISSYDPTTATFEEYPTPTPNAGISDLASDRWGRIWFTESAANQIGMLDLRSGSITEFAIPTANSGPTGISIDPTRDLIWFTESSTNKIGSLTLSKTAQYDTCAGDFDTDGDVDGSDLAEFSADFGRTNCPLP